MKFTLSKNRLALHACLALAAGALTAGCASNGAKKTETAIVEKPAIEKAVTVKSVADKPELAMPDQTVQAASATGVFPDVQIVENTKPEQSSFQFGFDKADLSDRDRQIVIKHARYLVDNPEMILKIQGHTDHHGPRAYNEFLSKKRAEAVAKILIEQGVQESQLEIIAMANQTPLADNKDTRKNRRVELKYSEINLVSNNKQ